MWLVGLGNPGPRYAGTRHNAGLELLLRLRDRWRARPLDRGSTFEAWVARVGERAVTLVAPLAYMNRSGTALADLEARRGERLVPEETLVLCDDVYLPVGTIRLRAHGSTGGHRGLASVEAHLGTSAYPRLRIGVGGAPGEALSDHVLSGWADDERARLEDGLARAEEASEAWVRDGVDAAMNRFNRRSEEEPS